MGTSAPFPDSGALARVSPSLPFPNPDCFQGWDLLIYHVSGLCHHQTVSPIVGRDLRL